MKKMSILFLSVLALAWIAFDQDIFAHSEKIFAALSNHKHPQNAVEHTHETEAKEPSSSHDHDHGHDHEEEGIVKLTADQIKNIGLEIQTAQPGKMTLTLSLRGKIAFDPSRLAHVIPKIAGIAKEARKNIGNAVREGEVMATLESQEVADLKAAYLAAESKERLAASIVERENKLYRKGVSAAQDFFNAKYAYEEAQIQLQLAIHKLRALGLSDEDIRNLVNHQGSDLRSYHIYAPIDGIVIMRHMTQGEYIENTATIYEIADFTQVWVEMGIYPKDLNRVQEGQMVEVIHPETQQSSLARLIYVSPVIANETITAKAIALLDNPQGTWRPGTSVKVNIITGQVSSPLLISKEAVQKMDGKNYVFIVTAKGFEKREVQLGQSDQQHVEVLSGLTPGEDYAANHSFILKAELNKESAEHEH